MDSNHIRVAIADDHPVIRLGIEAALDDIPIIQRMGSVQNSSELAALLNNHPCHLLVTDYAMPGGDHGDGLVLLSYLAEHYPELAIVVMTAIDKPIIIRALVTRGIQSILSKNDDISHVAHAVQATYAGRRYFSPTIAAIVQSIAEEPPFDALSIREAEVLSLYAAGHSIKDIGLQLDRSKQTVSGQKARAMAKLGIASDADLFKFGMELGLIVPPLAT